MATAPQVMVISLTRAADRRVAVAEQLGRHALDFRFFDAIDGATLDATPPQYDRKQRMKRYGLDLTAGELGCFLSHRAVWRECVASQRNVLVLEDDFRITGDLHGALDEISSITEPWDFIRLCGDRVVRRIAVPIRSFGSSCIAEELSDSMLTTAYLLSPPGAEKLIRESEKFHLPVDNFMEMRYAYGFRSLAVLPYPIEHAAVPSTIGDRRVRRKTLGLQMRRLWFRSLHDIRRYTWAVWRLYAARRSRQGRLP
ncbi:MAG: glycosyltransferase family 25 protein [Comamonadaceae bacterium]|nr:glycosyltransferase family 25 protein [Burkholderiales bacterium]MEB2347744.1 glycosyltransferase family 25 protein [Comamonadaceae bacterium]